MVDLEQFREAVEAQYELVRLGWLGGNATDTEMATATDRRDRLLSIIDSAGNVEAHHVSEVTRQLIERDRRGQAKYGTSLDRTDLSLPDWLQHMAEELLDAAGYALAAKREARQPAAVVDDARMARALEWVRALAKPCSAEEREMLSAIEEALAAYDPACGARTVRATLSSVQGVKSP